MKNLKSKIGIFLLIASFLFNLIISGISNYSFNSLLIKIISGVTSAIVILFFFKNELKEFLRSIKKSSVLLVVMFILYLSVSLLWSSNPGFGAEKVIHFVIGNGAMVLSFGVILGMEEGSRQSSVYSRQSSIGSGQSSVSSRQLALWIVIIGVIACAIAILLDPFDPNIPYSFELTRWSHVAFGRFTGLALIMAYLFMQYEIIIKKKLLYMSIIFLFIYSIIYSGYRGGMVAAVLAISIDTFYRIIRHPEIRIRAIMNYIIIAVIILLSFFIMNWNNGKMERWKNLTVLAGKEVIVDQSINSRIEGYTVAWKMFEDSPVTGSGLGSFNGNHYGSEIGVVLKYPHNIFLEFFCELGLIGFGFLSLFIGTIIKKLCQAKSELLVIFIYGIVLAMFSKDLGSNGLVWMCAACLVRTNLWVDAQKINFHRNRPQIKTD